MKWFSRKSKNVDQEIKQTSNINGIGVARISDIKQLIKWIEQNKVTKEYVDNQDTTTLESAKSYVDQAIANGGVDLSNYARKDQSNTFTNSQNIKSSAAFLSFTRNDNVRSGYVGKPSSSSNNIELRCETNSLILSANNNINLNAGNGYNVIINTTPTANNHVANKGYVDQAIANGGVDLSNVVKTNESANLEGQLYFFGNDQGVVGFAGKAQYSNSSYEPVESNEFANKGYVDSKISQGTTTVRKNGYYKWVKSDITSGLYNYKFKDNQIITINIKDNLVGKTVGIFLYLSSIDSSTNSNVIYDGKLIGYAYVSNVSQTYNVRLEPINILSTLDLKPGALGEFDALTRFECFIIES